jgi:hypothetical protein
MSDLEPKVTLHIGRKVWRSNAAVRVLWLAGGAMTLLAIALFFGWCAEHRCHKPVRPRQFTAQSLPNRAGNSHCAPGRDVGMGKHPTSRQPQTRHVSASDVVT